jgi:hypothetical protein
MMDPIARQSRDQPCVARIRIWNVLIHGNDRSIVLTATYSHNSSVAQPIFERTSMVVTSKIDHALFSKSSMRFARK